MVKKRPAVIAAGVALALLFVLAPASAGASPEAPSAVAAAKDRCGGLFVGEIVAFDGVQHLGDCTFDYSGNPIKVQILDLGVSIPPPLVFVAVIAFPGFPPQPTVIAECAGLLTCRGNGRYTPSGPLGNKLACVFGALTANVTVEVAYRFKCSSGDTGGILPIPL